LDGTAREDSDWDFMIISRVRPNILEIMKQISHDFPNAREVDIHWVVGPTTTIRLTTQEVLQWDPKHLAKAGVREAFEAYTRLSSET
jgi:hypothetical protein